MKHGRYEPAIKFYSLSLEANPKNTAALNNRSIAFSKMKMWELHKRCFFLCQDGTPKYQSIVPPGVCDDDAMSRRIENKGSTGRLSARPFFWTSERPRESTFEKNE